MILWTEQFVIPKQSSVAFAEQQSLLQSVLQSTYALHIVCSNLPMQSRAVLQSVLQSTARKTPAEQYPRAIPKQSRAAEQCYNLCYNRRLAPIPDRVTTRPVGEKPVTPVIKMSNLITYYTLHLIHIIKHLTCYKLHLTCYTLHLHVIHYTWHVIHDTLNVMP